MTDERYVLNCPRCGRVEGIVPSEDVSDPGSPPVSDEDIELRQVETASGPTARVRCPRCGGWIVPDRVRPA